jgi:hypothetical protein
MTTTRDNNATVAAVLAAAGGREHVRARARAGRPIPEYRSPSSVAEARRWLGAVRRDRARILADQVDAARAGYDLGVLASEERLAHGDYDQREALLTNWLASQ